MMPTTVFSARSAVWGRLMAGVAAGLALSLSAAIGPDRSHKPKVEVKILPPPPSERPGITMVPGLAGSLSGRFEDLVGEYRRGQFPEPG